MVQNHRVLMISRTEFSVCEGGTIGKRKETLLRLKIFTELEVSQFFCEFLDNRTGAVGVGEAWFRKVRAQLGDRVAQQPSEGHNVLSGAYDAGQFFDGVVCFGQAKVHSASPLGEHRIESAMAAGSAAVSSVSQGYEGGSRWLPFPVVWPRLVICFGKPRSSFRSGRRCGERGGP